MQDIGFDIISDLNLDPEQSFDWTNKPSSLCCIVPGNVSSNPRTVAQVLVHLSTLYQGVFYTTGTLEYQNCSSIPKRIKELNLICENIPNVCLLYKQVALINGVALLGVNGWNNAGNMGALGVLYKTAARQDDESYLAKSLSKLQKHLDVKNIILVSNAVPNDDLYFGERPEVEIEQTPLTDILEFDLERKVTHWVFGSYNKPVDTFLNGVNYVNNPYQPKTPYWPKRITISV